MSGAGIKNSRLIYDGAAGGREKGGTQLHEQLEQKGHRKERRYPYGQAVAWPVWNRIVGMGSFRARGPTGYPVRP